MLFNKNLCFGLLYGYSNLLKVIVILEAFNGFLMLQIASNGFLEMSLKFGFERNTGGMSMTLITDNRR